MFEKEEEGCFDDHDALHSINNNNNNNNNDKKFLRMTTMVGLLFGIIIIIFVVVLVTTQQSQSTTPQYNDNNNEIKEALNFSFLLLQVKNSTVLSEKILHKVILKHAINTSINNQTMNISYVPPVNSAKNVFESTSMLLITQAISKSINKKQQHDDDKNNNTDTDNKNLNMWQFLDSIFKCPSIMPSLEILPKYSYPPPPTPPTTTNNNNNPNNDSEDLYYIPNTRIPNWPVFTKKRRRQQQQQQQNSCKSSGRISAMSFHSTILLDIITSTATTDNYNIDNTHDIERIEYYFTQIYNHHKYIHQQVMRGCHDNIPTSSSSSSSTTMETTNIGNKTIPKPTPCYNVIHPWETLIDLSSDTWNIALQPALQQMKANGWKLPKPLPSQVTNSYDFNNNTYPAMRYLAECIAKVQVDKEESHDGQKNINTNNNVKTQTTINNFFDNIDQAIYEDSILHECSFAMLDVGYAAALAQADRDLYDIALWLSWHYTTLSKRTTTSSSPSLWTNAKLTQILQWRKQSEQVLDSLWNEQEQSYLSKYYEPSTQTMEFIKVPEANNFMIYWNDWERDQNNNIDIIDDDHTPHLNEMALALLKHDGKYAFDCGQYPLWSSGCLNDNDNNNNFVSPPLTTIQADNNTKNSNITSMIDPRLNYFIGTGLTQNRQNVAAFGDYITDATIQLICNKGTNKQPPPEDNDDNNDNIIIIFCANNNQIDNATWFQEAYEVDGSNSFHLQNEISMTTAAILFHLLTPTKHSRMTPIPPIRKPWVITLITAELMIAFSIGVSCFFLSFRLMRREQNLLVSSLSNSNNNNNNNDVMMNIHNDTGSYLALEMSDDNTTTTSTAAAAAPPPPLPAASVSSSSSSSSPLLRTSN